MTLLDQVLDRLQQEFSEAGKDELFDQFRTGLVLVKWLYGSPTHGASVVGPLCPRRQGPSGILGPPILSLSLSKAGGFPVYPSDGGALVWIPAG